MTKKLTLNPSTAHRLCDHPAVIDHGKTRKLTSLRELNYIFGCYDSINGVDIIIDEKAKVVDGELQYVRKNRDVEKLIKRLGL